jgi:hypothetical protein
MHHSHDKGRKGVSPGESLRLIRLISSYRIAGTREPIASCPRLVTTALKKRVNMH